MGGGGEGDMGQAKGGTEVPYDGRAYLETGTAIRGLFVVKPGIAPTRQNPRMGRSRRLSSLPEPITETEQLYKRLLDDAREEVKQKDIYILQLEGNLRSSKKSYQTIVYINRSLQSKVDELQHAQSISDEDDSLSPNAVRPARPCLSFDGMDTSPTASDSSHGAEAWSDAIVLQKRSAALQSGRKCERLTGLNPAQLTKFTSLCSEDVQKTTDSGEEKVRKTRTDEWRLSPSSQIFVALVWMRLYPPLWFLADYFSIPERYAQKVVKRAMCGMQRAVNGVSLGLGGVQWWADHDLADQKAEQKRFRFKKHSVGDVAIDGMHWPIQPPSKKGKTAEEKAEIDKTLSFLKNQKHQCYAVNLMPIVDLSGRFLHVDGPFLGQENSHLKEIQVVEGDSFIETLKRQKLKVLADAGLCVAKSANAEKDEDILVYSVCPSLVRLAKFVVLNAVAFDKKVVEFFTKVYNSTRIASRLRIVVENSIGFARRYRIVCLPFRGKGAIDGEGGLYSVSMETIKDVVFFLCNFRMLLGNAMRSNDWKPDFSSLPDDAEYGYPGNAINARALEDAAAKQILVKEKGKRGKMSLKEAYKRAVEMAEEAKKTGKVAKVVRVAKEVSTDGCVEDDLDDDPVESEDEDSVFEYGRIPGQGTTARSKAILEKKRAAVNGSADGAGEGRDDVPVAKKARTKNHRPKQACYGTETKKRARRRKDP